MKFKTINLFLTFLDECKEAFDHIAKLNWEKEIKNIRWIDTRRVWRIYVSNLSGVHDVWCVTEDGMTIYPADCITRLEYKGKKSGKAVWATIELTEAESEAVPWDGE